MDVSKIKGAYFLGIGGIGMSAIARYFVQQGISVFGYDKVRTSLCEKLEQEGMTIHYEDDSKKIPAEFIESPQTHICIYTPAIPTDFGEYTFLISKNIPLFKRADVLGFITKDSFTIAVAGTHGKTTTSTLLARALSAYDINFSAFLGGISTDFDTNFVSISNKKELYEKPIIVVEADEFDRSFLKLSPNIAIVTSTDADHLDIYGKESGVREGFEDFVKCIKEHGVLVQKKGLNLPYSDKIKSVTYGHKNTKANYTYNNPNFTYNRFIFAWQGPSEGLKVMLGIPGEHNAENATAVLAVLDKLKLDVAKSSKKIAFFKGVKRRFEKIFESKTHIVFDDYAHHPTELKAFISSVKKMYPTAKITGIFQPHLFSRTRDFMDGFAESLNLLDDCWLMDIYPAREKPIEGISSSVLSQKISSCSGVFSQEEILEKIKQNAPAVLLIMGAGDIDRLPKPISELYENIQVTA